MRPRHAAGVSSIRGISGEISNFGTGAVGAVAVAVTEMTVAVNRSKDQTKISVRP